MKLTRYFLVTLMLLCCSLNAEAKSLPSYLTVVTTPQTPPTPNQLATTQITSLDDDMQAIYANNLTAFEENFRKHYPIILALFSDEGGKFYLYRPGHSRPLIAPRVPVMYVLAKSVGHSSMATYQLLIPYAFNARANHSWQAPVRKFLTANKSALKEIGNLNVNASVKATFRNVIGRNIKFLSKCLKDGSYTLADIQAYARSQGKDIKKLIAYASKAQVNHWVSVLKKWEAMLGPQWKETYAVSNTLYVTRRENILFTILAQFMGKNAINDHLLLFGTTSFTADPKAILSELTRIVSDRAIGKIFFDSKMRMDVELLGEGAREQLKKDADKLQHPLLLPPVKPLDTHSYPWSSLRAYIKKLA